MPPKLSSKGLSIYVPPHRLFRLRAAFNGYTGYGLHGSYIARSFFNFGYEVKAHPLSIDDTCFDDVRDLTSDQPVDGNCLFLAPPSTKVEGAAWFYTMHETTRMPEAVLANVRQAQVVLVPSRWCQQCFDAQGVDAPIYVVPIGINTDYYRPAKHKPRICTFGSAGNLLLSGPQRKNVDLLVSAFMEAFRKEKDVRLSLKIRPECPLPDLHDSRILVIRQHFTELELADWYRTLTAYVSPSRCEAFGQMNLQAMACGVPVVCCNFGGVTDYHGEPHGYSIDYQTAQPKEGYYNSGLWADPDVDSLVAQLRRVYENQREAHQKGLLAQRVATAYDWNVVNLQLESTLKRTGFWNGERKATPVRQFETKMETAVAPHIEVPAPVLTPVVSNVKYKSLWSNEAKSPAAKVPLWLARRCGGHEPVFYMSGDLGDILYALPTIEGLGGGQLCIGPARDHPYYWLREPMTPARYSAIQPLLALQKAYLSNVLWSDEMAGWKCHVDLNDSRRLHREPYYVVERNLSDVASCYFGLGPGLWKKKWLTVDKANPIARFVFARSPRYHKDDFPWRQIVEKHRAKAVFVGLQSEYDQFVADCGHVPYAPTANLLEVARIVAGAAWLVCNQSAPLALAEGLKTNVLLERFAAAANCDYERPGHVTDPAYVLDLC